MIFNELFVAGKAMGIFMTNLKLQKKSIERNNFYKALICIVFALFSAFLLYSFISCVNEADTPSLYMLSNTLYTLPYLIIFFIFFTFECCYRLNKYYEPICITNKSMKYVYKNQLQAIFLYDLLLFAESLLLNIIYILVNKQFSFTLLCHTFIVLAIYFLLCILSAIFIGFLLSQIRQKFISYLIMIVIAISETNLMDSLSVGIYNSLDIDITKLLNFFNLTLASVYWTPNMHLGYVITLDKLSQILFFIFLSLFFYYLTNILRNKKQTFRCLICFCLCVLTIIGYILPFSAPRMDLSASGASSDTRYYDKHNQLIEAANFKVESYDLKFQFSNRLIAAATIKVSSNSESEYKFTLFHGYKVHKVTDINDNILNFTRNSDYLTIDNTTNSEYVTIYYSGSCSKYYSNYSSVFLPGNFAYYPIPGFNEIYSTSSYSGFQDLSLAYKADFNVKVDSLRKMHCNLEGSNNEFKGTSNSLTLLSGFINCIKINETEIYYPYFNDAYNSDNINKKLHNFVSTNPEIKKIFIIPDVNLEDIEFAKTYEDYMITASIDDIERIAFISKLSAKKMELYDAVDAYLNMPEYFEFLKDHSSDELQSAIPLLEEVLKNDTDGKKIEKINQYLIDKNDNRNFLQLLKELR